MNLNCILIILTHSLIFCQPSVDWFTDYNGSGEESHGHYILACEDGGFLQVGETGFIPQSAKMYIVKTDANGNLLWEREINTGGHNLGNSAYEIEDGYLICGAMNRNSALIKVDKFDGSILFSQTYNNGGTDAIEHIVSIPGGYAAVGYKHAQDPNNTFFTEGQGVLMLLDLDGNSTEVINLNAYISQAYRIQQYNGELIIAGLTEEALDYKVIKTDFNGIVIWHQSYGGNDSDHCFGMDINANGEIFLTGHTLSGTENWDTYTVKLDNNGGVLWEQIKGNPRGFDPEFIHDEAWGVRATSDGGCIIIAGTGDEYGSYSECNGEDCSDTWNAYIIKYGSAGTLEWETAYSSLAVTGEGNDWAGEDIAITQEGGAIAAIDNGQFGFLKLSGIVNQLLGDINQDNEINVLDVVVLVNLILVGEYQPNADLNDDTETNILDIVLLVNLILD